LSARKLLLGGCRLERSWAVPVRQPPPWAIKTGTELAAEAEQSLVEIDAEIARVT